MKKITFILFALIAGTTFAQDSFSDEGTAIVNAQLVTPISISETGSALNFGRIINGVGTVQITPASSAVRTGTAALLVPGELVSSSAFTITASSEHLYKIEIADIVLDGANTSSTIPVTFSSSLGFINIKGVTAGEQLYVGGEVTLDGTQAEDIYEGTVTVKVAYE